MHPIEVLERYWGYTEFRPLQESIINAVLEQDDTFALLPTGGGKSICFQIPALIKDGICIVISPLIALMKDQVNTLKSKGIKAIALTSGMSYNELDTQLDNCIYGNYKFLYLSPERLQQQLVRDRIERMHINLIAVDEAHCISQWGNDFRPAYKNIGLLRQIHPSVNCIALTASAKRSIVKDIIENLDFINPKIFKASFVRPNISYQVLQTDDKLFQLQHILNKYKGASIIYVRNRKATKDIHSFLESKNFSSSYYHGGITNKEKQERLLAWRNGQKQIMIATTAFGMGIDKANVKTVIHFNLPENIESYYQEAGRAGRNGENAYAFILMQPIDENRLRSQFLNTLPSVSFIKSIYKKLCNYFQIAFGEGENDTFQFDFKSFCTTYDLKQNLTYNTLLILDRNSIITLTQHFNYRTKVQILMSNHQLFEYLEKQLHLNNLVKILLRTYGGIFDYETKVNLKLIAQKINLTEKQIVNQLQLLEKDGVLSLQVAHTDAEITFLKPREDDATINPILKIVKQQHLLKHEQVNAVLDYVNNQEICRSVQLLEYFGETTTKPCGICSVCLDKSTIPRSHLKNEVSDKILALLKNQDLSSRQLLGHIDCSEKQLITHLKQLIEIKKIKITSRNSYTLI